MVVAARKETSPQRAEHRALGEWRQLANGIGTTAYRSTDHTSTPARSSDCRRSFPGWLLLGFGVVVNSSRNQACDEGSEQGFAASAGVVHELEEAEVKRQLVLRDASVRSQPGA